MATINEALHAQARRAEASEFLAALADVPMEFAGSAQGFRLGGGRDLSHLDPS